MNAMAVAAPVVTWTDPNPATAGVVAYIVYQKVTASNGTVTWKPIWKVTAGQEFDLPKATVTRVVRVSALNSLGVESPMSNELIVPAPLAPEDLRIK